MLKLEGSPNPNVTLLVDAIVAWSFEEELTPENIVDLDPAIAVDVFVEIGKYLPKALLAQEQPTTEEPPTPSSSEA